MRAVMIADRFGNLVENNLRFVKFVLRLDQQDRLAHFALGPQLFRQALAIVRNDGMRRFENVAGRAIILLEPKNLAIRKVLLKIDNVTDFRAAPAINGLIVIADGKNVARAAGQRLQKNILRPIRVLKLVDQNITKPIRVTGKNVRILAKQLQRVKQQIIKIHRVAFTQALLIMRVNLRNTFIAFIAVTGNHTLPIFGARNAIVHVTGSETGGSDIEIGNNLPDNTKLIFGIIN
ncbi:MAG: hypothetical protein ALAOOOJD_04181 [bacterium]|nr:hypothetical protein [bacterium]